MSTKKWFPFAPPASVSRPKEVPIAIAIASVEKTALMEDSSLVKVQSRSEMSALKMSETMALLLIPTPEASPLLLHFSGHGHLTLLKGECEVHGFQLGLGDRREVTCPSWMPSYPILCSKGKKIRKGLFPMTLPCLQDKELIASLSSYDVVLCLEGEEVSKLEWLVRVDVGQDQIRALEVAHASGEVLSCDFIALRSLLLYKSNTFSAPSTLPESLDLESLIIPGSWSTAIKTVCAAPPYSSPRTLFCGAKGVGKSTCLRQTINALLSKRRGVKYAAVIDCDIGQPEFSLPGFVSLTMLNTDSPRLVPPHLSLVSPTLQFFLGDVTNKNEPQFLPSALRQCFLRYEELKAEIEEHGDLEAVASRTKLKNGGQFAPLLSKERGELPLLINTDGWIKGMGLEVLFEVIRATQPSFILHLTSPRNADLPALSVAPENAVIITLETGRDVPSRVLSADLRLLRYRSQPCYYPSSSLIYPVCVDSLPISCDTQALLP